MTKFRLVQRHLLPVSLRKRKKMNGEREKKKKKKNGMIIVRRQYCWRRKWKKKKLAERGKKTERMTRVELRIWFVRETYFILFASCCHRPSPTNMENQTKVMRTTKLWGVHVRSFAFCLCLWLMRIKLPLPKFHKIRGTQKKKKIVYVCVCLVNEKNQHLPLQRGLDEPQIGVPLQN